MTTNLEQVPPRHFLSHPDRMVGDMGSITADRLERELIENEAIVARARARTMELLLLADSMQVPLSDGCRTLREWAAARLDISVETAYSLATTARRLADAPRLARQLAAGDITFDRAEATARVPQEHQTDELLGLDISGVRRVAAHHRRITSTEDHESHRSQHLIVQPNLDESRWDIYGRLDGYGGAVVSKVLTEEADLLGPMPDGSLPGIGYRRAVALSKICEDRGQSTDSPRTPLVTVFVDDRTIEIEGAVPGGYQIIDKIACTGVFEVIRTSGGAPISVGRTRPIPPSLRRFILHRDGGCTAEGCTSRYRLEPHHKTPRSQGGSNHPENLTTLCWFHHHVVIHGMGYRIDASRGPGRIRFVRPTGIHDPPG